MRYLTVSQKLHVNAARHLSNAIGYANKGWASHCDGSIKKAVRNFKRAVELDRFTEDWQIPEPTK